MDERRTGWACGRVGLKAKDGRQLSVSDGKTRGRENEGQHIYDNPDHVISALSS